MKRLDEKWPLQHHCAGCDPGHGVDDLDALAADVPPVKRVCSVDSHRQIETEHDSAGFQRFHAVSDRAMPSGGTGDQTVVQFHRGPSVRRPQHVFVAGKASHQLVHLPRNDRSEHSPVHIADRL